MGRGPVVSESRGSLCPGTAHPCSMGSHGKVKPGEWERLSHFPALSDPPLWARGAESQTQERALRIKKRKETRKVINERRMGGLGRVTPLSRHLRE